MIRHLSINNLLLIDKIEMDIGLGLCVLTGETGAGKSILSINTIATKTSKNNKAVLTNSLIIKLYFPPLVFL